MLYLGIDIGKNNHVASMLNENGKPVFRAFTFPNTTEGAISLLEKLKSCQANAETVEIGMEATGHYWLALYSFLVEHHFVIHVVNPIQTDGWRKGAEIRKRKTDIIDSVLIADLIRYGSFVETSLANEDVMSLRNLSRFRNYLVSSISDLKRKVICVLDQVFPEYVSAFSNIFGQTSKELLLHFQTAEDFETITAEQLEKALEQVTFKNKAREKAKLLSEMASTSFGLKFCRDSFSLQLKLLIQQIQFIESQVTDVEQEMNVILEKLHSPRVCQEICVKKREEVCSRRGSFRVSLEQALECADKCHHPSPADYGQAPSSGSDDRPTSFPAPSRVGREVSGASLHWERRLCG